MARRAVNFTAYDLKHTLADLYNSLLVGSVAKVDMPRFSDAVLHVIAAVHVIEPEMSVLGPAEIVPLPLPPDPRQESLHL